VKELRTNATVYRNTPKIENLLENFYSVLKDVSIDAGLSDVIQQAAAEATALSADALGKNHPITKSFNHTPLGLEGNTLTCGR
jgi:hypothetical protein